MSPEIISNILDIATQRLIEAGCDTPRLDAELLLTHILNKERTWLYIYPFECLDKNQVDKFYDLLRRRERREPVAYIIGYKEFFNLDFVVNRHVLIPRPETELLVETAIQLSKNRLSPFVIADVGAGSGCITVALAKNLSQAHLLAIDISNEALHVVRENAARHNVLDRVTFLSGNLLQPLPYPVDLIVSNPPYLRQSELATSVSPEISQYEPRSALAGGEDGLEVIRQLLSQAREKLKPEGVLLIEIGSAQGPAVLGLAEANFPGANIYLKKDLADLPRLLVVTEIGH